jgi:hypothetical protein
VAFVVYAVRIVYELHTPWSALVGLVHLTSGGLRTERAAARLGSYGSLPAPWLHLGICGIMLIGDLNRQRTTINPPSPTLPLRSLPQFPPGGRGTWPAALVGGIEARLLVMSVPQPEHLFPRWTGVSPTPHLVALAEGA